MAAHKFLQPIDLAKNELQNAVLQNLASDPSSPVAGQFYFNTGDGLMRVYDGAAWDSFGAGTVSSVALALPAEFTISGSPVTTTGTLTGSWANQTTNKVFAAPNGSTGTPTFRLLVAADIPTLTAAKISDFDTQVRTSRLDQMAAPTASVALNSQKITGLADGVASTDAATVGQVTASFEGKVWKDPVDAMTTAALPAVTATTTTLTANANGALAAQDGITLVAGDSLLVKNQAAGAQNGIYTVTQVGTGGTPFILTRRSDANTAAELTRATILVRQGTTGVGDGYTFPTITTLGTTDATPVKTSEGNTTYTADGTTLTLTGTTFSINTSYVGQASIVTLGTVTTGTWSATTIALNKGGTGATTAAAARTNLGATGKYTALIGDGAATSIAVTQGTHGLATDASMHVAVYDASTGNQVYPGVSINNSNGTVTFTFNVAPASNAYRIVLVG